MIDIVALKEGVSLEDVLEFLELDSGFIAVSTQRHPKVLCPFPDHDERTPSCVLYPEEGRVWCYGCDRGGDIIDLVRLVKGVDFIDAADQLTQHFGLEGFSKRQPTPGLGPEQLYAQVEKQAYADVLGWVKQHPITVEMADVVFPVYDEIVRQHLTGEIGTEDAVERLLTWRTLWKNRLA